MANSQPCHLVKVPEVTGGMLAMLLVFSYRDSTVAH